MQRATRRPANIRPPEHLSPSPPVPAPEPMDAEPSLAPLDPTRYGDWEKKGMAIDF